MAYISASMFTTMSSLNSRNGIVGLASGINTNEMIEKMTLSTRSKLAALLQRQTRVAWKMEAYQSVTSALLDFKNKFMSATSALNMRNANFFQSATITALGANAGAVSVTGTMSSVINNFSILSVENLAASASFMASNFASQNAIVSKDISGYIDDGLTTAKFEGESITLEVDGKRHVITLKGVDLKDVLGNPTVAKDNADNIVAALNRGLKDAGLENIVKASLTGDGKVELRVTGSNSEFMEITAVGSGISNHLGLIRGATGGGSAGTPITGSFDITDTDKAESIINTQSFAEVLYGKSVTFNLNGVSKTITFNKADIDTNYNAFANIVDVKNYLDDKLGEAFGTIGVSGPPKVFVDFDGGQLRFETTDKTSILSVANGSEYVIGADGSIGVLGIDFADANRLMMDRALSETNLNDDAAALFQTSTFLDGTSSVDMEINGVNFSIYNDKIVINEGLVGERTYRYASGTTMRDVMNTINNSSAGVRMQYNSTTDSFSLSATDPGSTGSIKVAGGLFADAIFGDDKTGVTHTGTDSNIWVSFDGGATSTMVTRSSNNFTLNGLNITLNNTFNTEFDPLDPPEVGYITFTAKPNTDVVVDGIKEMVTAYNALIDMISKQLTTKPDRSFQPLTSEQKKQMSQDEIERWEAKAKEGLLFGDSLLSSLMTELRFAFSLPVGGAALNQIGIKSSSAWQDNGKLTIDEAALRRAIENDAEKVADIFTKALTGTASASNQDAGIFARLDFVMEKYTSTMTTSSGARRGLLIERAGHESSPLSMLNNAMYREIQSFESQIKTVQTRLFAQEARYARQFAALEQYISAMNQQSSWLAQAFSNDSNSNY